MYTTYIINMRDAGNTALALRGEETSGTPKKMNTRRNNTNHIFKKLGYPKKKH